MKFSISVSAATYAHIAAIAARTDTSLRAVLEQLLASELPDPARIDIRPVRRRKPRPRRKPVNLRTATRRPADITPIVWHRELARREVARHWGHRAINSGARPRFEREVSEAFHRRLRAAGIQVEQ